MMCSKTLGRVVYLIMPRFKIPTHHFVLFASPHCPTVSTFISVLHKSIMLAKNYAANSSFSCDHYVLLFWPAPNRTQLPFPQALFVYMPVGVLVCIP